MFPETSKDQTVPSTLNNEQAKKIRWCHHASFIIDIPAAQGYFSAQTLTRIYIVMLHDVEQPVPSKTLNKSDRIFNRVYILAGNLSLKSLGLHLLIESPVLEVIKSEVQVTRSSVPANYTSDFVARLLKIAGLPTLTHFINS